MLTDVKVRTAKPRPKSYKLTDANRLFLLVAPSGGKLWRWNYNYDGKNKTMAFGAYPLVSLADARAKRDEARKMAQTGSDPAVAKREARIAKRIFFIGVRVFGGRRRISRFSNVRFRFATPFSCLREL